MSNKKLNVVMTAATLSAGLASTVAPVLAEETGATEAMVSTVGEAKNETTETQESLDVASMPDATAIPEATTQRDIAQVVVEEDQKVVDEAQNVYDEKNETREDAQATYDQKVAEEHKAEQAVTNAEGVVSDIEETINSTNSDLSEATLEAEGAEERKEEAATLVDTTETAMTDAKSELTDATTVQEDAQNTYDAIDHDAIRTADETLEAAQNNQAENQKAADEAKTIADQKAAELTEAQEKLESATQAVTDAKVELADATTAQETAKTELEAAQNAFDEAKTDYEAKVANQQDAQNAYDNAQAEFYSAKEEYELADTNANKAAADLESATNKKKATDTAVAEQSELVDQLQNDFDAKYNTADKEAAKKALEEAEATLTNAKEEQATAQAEYDTAKSTLEAEQAKADKLNNELNALQEVVTTKENELAEAQSAQSTKEAELSELESTLADKEAAKVAADEALAVAQSAVTAAQQAEAEAKADVDAKTAELSEGGKYDQAISEAQAVISQGSLGFFQSLADNGAISSDEMKAISDVLSTNSDTKVGVDTNDRTYSGQFTDATCLQNVQKAIEMIKVGNERRALEGLEPLKITSLLMAIAEVQSNASAVDYEHSGLYNVSENLMLTGKDYYPDGSVAGEDNDPYDAWYDNEKKNYDDPSRKGQTGHYKILTDKYAVSQSGNHSVNTATGYGIHSDYITEVIPGFMTLTKDEHTNNQVFSTDLVDKNGKVIYQGNYNDLGVHVEGYGNKFDVDTYYNTFMSYYDGVKAQLDSAVKAKSDAQARLDEAKRTYDEAVEFTLTTARNSASNIASAENAVADAKQAIVEAQNAVDSKNAEINQIKDNIVAINAEIKSANDNVDAKQNEIDAYNAINALADATTDEANKKNTLTEKIQATSAAQSDRDHKNDLAYPDQSLEKAAYEELQSAKEQLNTLLAEQIVNNATFETAATTKKAADTTLANANADMVSKVSDLDRAADELNDKKAITEASKTVLDEKAQTLAEMTANDKAANSRTENAKSALTSANNALNTAKDEFADAQKVAAETAGNYQTAHKNFLDAVQATVDAEVASSKLHKELGDATEALNGAMAATAEKQSAYDSALEAYNSAVNAFSFYSDENITKLRDALTAAEDELKVAEDKLSDARNAYETARENSEEALIALTVAEADAQDALNVLNEMKGYLDEAKGVLAKKQSVLDKLVKAAEEAARAVVNANNTMSYPAGYVPNHSLSAGDTWTDENGTKFTALGNGMYYSEAGNLFSDDKLVGTIDTTTGEITLIQSIVSVVQNPIRRITKNIANVSGSNITSAIENTSVAETKSETTDKNSEGNIPADSDKNMTVAETTSTPEITYESPEVKEGEKNNGYSIAIVAGSLAILVGVGVFMTHRSHQGK